MAEQSREKARLLQLLHDAAVFKFGDYYLKSGQYTPVYVDLRSLISKPALFNEAVDALWAVAQQKQFDVLCGVPQAAIPLATGLMSRHGKPMVLQRKEAKAYGTKKRVEGDYGDGDGCLVVEDVTVLGWSIVETAKTLRDCGLRVSDALTLVERQQGAVDNLKQADIHLSAIFTLREVLAYEVTKGVITKERATEIQTQLADTSYLDKCQRSDTESEMNS